MESSIFTEKDQEQIKQLGKTEANVLQEIALFQKGAPFVKLHRPCTLRDGVVEIPEKEHSRYLEIFKVASFEGRLTKFVPASGAATRMFQVLNTFLNQFPSISLKDIRHLAHSKGGEYSEFVDFAENIKKFAFYNDLRYTMAKSGLDIEQEIASDEWKNILKYLLTSDGLDYQALPKLLIPFHAYDKGIRTPLEEHLVEAMEYTKDKDCVCRSHFTISPSHEVMIRRRLAIIREDIGKGMHFDIQFSFQNPSTDTIVVDMENRPFRDEKGQLMFRPGGHGALIENLSGMDADLVIVKNVDNVVPDRNKVKTYLYKKLLVGYLVDIQNQLFQHLRLLKEGQVKNKKQFQEIILFAEKMLNCKIPDRWKKDGQKDQTVLSGLVRLLNRPIRVCGVVKNEGEPGGCPFWIEDADGNISPQLVEKSEINIQDVSQKDVFQSSTYFNPVDLVCAIRGYDGQKFDLLQFMDTSRVFLSQKSYQGKKIKALELPGLWNGCMANWITVFVDVPLETFNPVKTVNDLLRGMHCQK